MKRILDVSHHQIPSLFDWPALAKTCDGMYIRATYGANTLDKRYAEFARLCVEHGIPFGPYLFYRQTQDPAVQLAAFRKHVAACQYQPSLIPMLDLEGNSAHGDGKPIAAKFNVDARGMAEALRDEYGACLLYLASFFPSWMGAAHSDDWAWIKQQGYVLHAADYNTPAGHPRKPYFEATLHQSLPKPIPEYRGTHNGKRSPVDVNWSCGEDFSVDDLEIPPPQMQWDTDSHEAEAQDAHQDARPGGALPEDTIRSHAEQILAAGQSLTEAGQILLDA